MKIDISMGLTVCTDPELNNYAKLGFRIIEIDPAGDVEAQAKEGVAAILTAFEVANDGMGEAVVGTISGLSEIEPEGLRSEFAAMSDYITHLKKRLLPNVIGEVRRLRTIVDPEAETETGEMKSDA